MADGARRPRASASAPDADRLLDRFADGVPGRRPDARAGRPSARGAAADPGRQREPGDRRRSASSSTTAPLARARATARRSPRLEAVVRRRADRSTTGGSSLIELLRAPARHAPTSLAGQLRYIRERWARDARATASRTLIRRLDIAIGILAEEERGAPSAVRRRRRAAGRRRRPRRRRSAAAADEPEAFSSDSAWMPRVVLMAKSTYVWLDQLSRTLRPRHPDARRDPRRGARHARALGRHRAVADRPVGALAGVGADQADARQPRRGRLGLLARRLPDRRRPRRRGGLREPARPGVGARHPPGQRHGAQPHGHRLALGHRAPGVVPVAAPSRPTRRTRSTGPTCRPTRGSGSSSRTTTGTTATRRSCSSGSTARPATTRYIYHGNDGTSFPWNDTAQLDFLDPAVREAGHPDHPRRRPALPDHPLRRRDGPRQEAHPAAVVAGARAAAAASRRAPSTP